MNGKALERRTTLAVSAWPVPLSLPGFSASNPITGTESLAYWCSSMPSLGGVRHLSGLIFLSGWAPPLAFVPWGRSSWAILSLVSG